MLRRTILFLAISFAFTLTMHSQITYYCMEWKYPLGDGSVVADLTANGYSCSASVYKINSFSTCYIENYGVSCSTFPDNYACFSGASAGLLAYFSIYWTETCGWGITMAFHYNESVWTRFPAMCNDC